jgi:hypothetical protein
MPFFDPGSTHWSQKGPIHTKTSLSIYLFVSSQNIFCHKKNIFCKAKSLLVARRLLTPKKVLFEPKKQNSDQNRHFLALNNPNWSKKWLFTAKTSLYYGTFAPY